MITINNYTEPSAVCSTYHALCGGVNIVRVTIVDETYNLRTELILPAEMARKIGETVNSTPRIIE